MELIADKDNAISVSQYLDILNETLGLGKFLIQGEVSSLNLRGNVAYFTLTDTKDKAVLNCLIWKNVYSNYDTIIKEGDEIQVYGYASVYKPYGKLSFQVYRASPVGEGALQKAFELLKQKLLKEKLFDPELKTPLPNYINKIGLITAKGSDALQDFTTHLEPRNIEICFKDVKVEGINSIPMVVEAIKYFNQPNNKVDVIVITRGGGSLESLQSFNSEEVSREAFNSKVPIISAVGHENDISILDLVADIRCSTPTDAGKTISNIFNKIDDALKMYDKNVQSNFMYILNKIEAKFTKHYSEICKNFELLIVANKNKITHLVTNLNKINTLIINTEYKVDKLKNSIIQAFKDSLNEKYNYLEKLQIKIENLNPEKILHLGYSITTTQDGIVIKDISNLKKGDKIITKLNKGQIHSEINDVKK
jgi:exodeoxyribonuclease VII large subunit